ncbi:hypothetical protein ES703_99411 [subsurface metagenome]
MAMIDVRPPVDLDQAIRLNLAMAENPRKHIETVPPVGIEIGGGDPRVQTAASLGRGAAATVVILSAAKFEGRTKFWITALDPTFFGCSENLLKEGKFSPLNLAKLVYRACGSEFDLSQVKYADIQLIFKIRNEIIHDTPIEGHYEDTTTKARKWRKLLTARVKDLDWLPKIRKTGSDDLFSIGGEPPVSKVLIYPVAAWAANAVDTVLTEMDDIVLKKAGGKRLDPSGQIKFKLATERWQAAGY